MNFETLLVSPDQQAITVVAPILEDLGSDVELCAATERALRKLAGQPYDTVIMDCEVEGAREVFRRARNGWTRRSGVAMALVGGAGIGDAFAMGADLAIHKPLQTRAARASLRAAQGLIGRERRRAIRQSLKFTAWLDVTGMRPMKAIILDLSETGMSVQALHVLDPGQGLGARFHLPGNPRLVEVPCEVMWANERGEAGLAFQQLTPGLRRNLELWVERLRPWQPELQRTPRTVASRPHQSLLRRTMSAALRTARMRVW